MSESPERYNQRESMLIRKLTSAECEEVLARTTLGRLACARADQPYVVPISFYFAPTDRCLYGFSTVGQKIKWMRSNPKVCLQADDIVDRFHWSSVLVLGRYEELTKTTPESAELRRAREELQARPSWWLPWWLPGAAKLDDGSEHETPLFYRIIIGTMTGRRAERDREI